MEKVLIVVVAFLAIQSSIAKPAPQKGPMETIADNVKTIGDNISKTLGVQDITSEKVLKTINDQAKVFADNLNQIKTKVDKEIKAHDGEVQKTLKTFEGKLGEALASIQKVVDQIDPEKKMQKSTEEIRKQFDASFKTVTDGFEKMSKNLQPSVNEANTKITQLTKQIADNLTQVGKDVETKLKKAVDDHQKTHKI
nr:uncharacterized protein LOC111418202 [Onthophagus taurus]XP_022906460.1 uncharacterized protein LOC111418202 [Onthophagus taurus]XP_022906461.1 uncharacterized protein LOC111418202 [Onthophagus taurus]XP_022912461.1 uncharacterized protein LOC111423467 [Onthophagus taurus]XP_022912462.1 uncharacterized protein LOC111423467 [Onthophagus taurus]XP_022912463.1 uncharacterized protein LOC111423467 [Onthophagus taurus]XP_022912464.1 uncharacterized protein LOC111423467 [Onthophagus taurus]